MLNPLNVGMEILEYGLSKIQQKVYNYKSSQIIDKSIGTRPTQHTTSQICHPIIACHMEKDGFFDTWHVFHAIRLST